MRSILEEFAQGNIYPDNQPLKRDSPLGQATDAVFECEEALLKHLNDEEKVLLDAYTDAQIELHRLTATKSLVYGYKLGLLMTAEAFLTSKDLLS